MKKYGMVLFILLGTALLYAQAKPTIAILPFTGGQGEDGETIAELFSFEPALTAAFTPIPRTSITRAIRNEQKFQMNSGMTDPDTIIAIGKQIGAGFIVAGTISAVGNQKLLIITIINIAKLQQIAGDYQSYTQIEEIQDKLPGMARNIAAASKIDTSKLPKLAVVPFQLRTSTNAGDADALALILSINIIRSGKYAVYPRTASLEQVQDEYTTQFNGDTAEEQVVSIGRGENPQLVLSGTARRLGTTRNMFNALIINLSTGAQEAGATVNYESLDDGITAMEKLAETLAPKPAPIPITNYIATNEETFKQAIAGIDAQGAGNYTITLRGDFSSSGLTFATNAPKTITLKGDTQLRTITNNNANSDLFAVPNGITLVLGNNVKLDGGRVVVNKGSLRMEAGSFVTNSRIGGIFVGDDGTFTMNGGTISGNSVTNFFGYGEGGGVSVRGTFTMSGGTISGNSANSDGDGNGGGVYVSGTFTMSGGTISGNSANGNGGGVSVRGTFTMSGGTISGNSANGNGGGVYVSSGTFIKTGGTIDGKNHAKGQGDTVYVDRGKKYRNWAAGPDVNLDSRKDGRAGGW